MKVVQVIATLDPAYGGPVEALAQSTRALLELGHVTETVCMDDPRAAWLDGFPGTVHPLGPGRWGRYSYGGQLNEWLAEHSRNFDAVIAHGIWQYHSLAVWRVCRKLSVPYLVFVHGALDPWFKKRYPLKQLKKWLYWPGIEYRVLRDAAAVVFMTEEERVLARQSFWLYRANEAVVVFGISDPSVDSPDEGGADGHAGADRGGDADRQRRLFLSQYSELQDRRILLFLGRLHQKKGCDLLIEAFARVCGRDDRLRLVMAGPDQEGWQRRLEAQARAHGIGDRIVWTGLLTGDLKWGAFRQAESFILPSHSESFGVAVVEALACGVPALITDKVNIWREVKAAGAGLVAEDTLSGTTLLLEKWLSLPAEEKQAMKQRARACFLAQFEIHRTAAALAELVETRRARASSPSA